MCGGICGPSGPTTGKRYAARKPIERKTPYKSVNGKVLAYNDTGSMVVELSENKNGGYTVSWHSILSSGAAGYTKKVNAIREYNSHVPNEKRISIV
jgi:hypothetical protein